MAASSPSTNRPASMKRTIPKRSTAAAGNRTAVAPVDGEKGAGRLAGFVKLMRSIPLQQELLRLCVAGLRFALSPLVKRVEPLGCGGHAAFGGFAIPLESLEWIRIREQARLG